MARGYIVGIDLGTTHTVVAYAEPGAGPDEVKLLSMPQLVGAGQRGLRELLPSCLYAPLDDEASEARWRLSAAPERGDWLVGEHARVRGEEVTQRLVSSAKSWLSYAQVDRRAPILPWQLAGDPEAGEGAVEVPRLSPVEASCLLLRHVRRAWDETFPKAPLDEQEVVLTVPASFDAVARELTVEAARAAGLDVRLLEEPQAAFYDFMRVGGDEALEGVMGEGDEGAVLVCDVGGGTTDLSLMKVRRVDDEAATIGKCEVERVAVGRHLLLGGDNMDLALAHVCEGRLVGDGERLGQRRFAQLVAACRGAKERLLAEGAPDEVSITLLGRGAKLIGSALKTKLARGEVEQLVLEGFVPEVPLDAQLGAGTRAGIVAFGLPFEREVAITKHLAAFARRHAASEQDTARTQPLALLLNGGVFRSAAVAARVYDTLARWGGGEAHLLDLTDPDTSVALGAVAYGLALRGKGRRIAGGAARTLLLGLGGREQQAICVLPRGTEEGKLCRAEQRGVEVTVGRTVRFDLYASDGVGQVGQVVTLDPAEHERLAPLVTKLDDYSGQSGQLRVVLEAQLSAIGTLELSCASEQQGARRYALAFDLRVEQVDGEVAHEVTTATARYGKRLDEARAAVERVYSKKSRKQVPTKEVKGLLRELERIFGKRGKWDASLNRALYDVMWRHHRGRRTSLEHERMFWMVAGFCLRPGSGHARDPERAEQLFELLQYRIAHGELRSWQQFWIAWRRVAAGLDETAQCKLRDVLDPFLAPSEKRLKKVKSFRNEADWEMLELAAALERVPAQRRGELGGWVLERTWTERDPRLWAALGRIGARTPVYGSAHHAVAARTIERWMDHLLRERWDAIPSAPRAAVAMCRVTGDRARDLSEATRAKVAVRLEKLEVPEPLRRPVLELVPLDDRDRADLYGEDLPVGLRLVEDEGDDG